MTETLLDQAWAASEAAPDDGALRLRYFGRLAEAELFLLLAQEAEGDQISPKVFDLEDGPLVLAFDTEARLTEFTGLPAPYAALPGRALVEMLVGQGIGLGLNLGVAPSSRLLSPEILDWLAQMLAERPEELSARIIALHPPKGLPEALLVALDQRLARMEGLAQMAYLVGTEAEGGARGHMLVVIDPAQGAEAALARRVQAALSFSGVEAGLLDVTFLRAEDARAADCARVGLRFDLPQAQSAATEAHTPPGLDPQRPPRLR
ncbi:MAG: SseB family protein [Rhodobacteraceae bacterium]|nr:MAG: SseB family protein [Paracoccaceae bacterium]